MKQVFFICLLAFSMVAFAQPKPTSNWITELFGESLVNAKGEKIDSNALKNKIVGVYFSAHWCPPCRQFTPELVKFRNKLVEGKSSFEVVFVSSDRSEKDMKKYMKEAKMKWKAVPFDSPVRRKIQEKYHVNGIPMLIILGPDGEIISASGREDVMKYPQNAYVKWKNEYKSKH